MTGACIDAECLGTCCLARPFLIQISLWNSKHGEEALNSRSIELKSQQRQLGAREDEPEARIRK